MAEDIRPDSEGHPPITRSRQEQLRERCQRFHEEHPEVWTYFVRFTFELIQRGRKRGSADAVMHRVRWETDAGGDGVAGFKINDHYTAFYARRFLARYPEYADFFETRKQRSQYRDAD